MELDDERYVQPFQISGTEPELAAADVDDGSEPDLPPPPAYYHPEWYKLHPGFLESLLPVWGPGRQAAVDSANGDSLGWAINTGLAITDATGVGTLLRDGVKLGSHTWPATRAWLTKTGFADKGQVVHHAFFERNQKIGKYLPDWFKNQPFNLKPMPSAQIHDRMTHAAWGQPQLDIFRQWHYGVPDWAKWTQAGLAARAASGLRGLLGDWRAHQSPNNPQANNRRQGGQ